MIVVGRLDQRSWETEGGDKRSKVEIVADEVGPSLRWATATVSKNERRETAAGQAPRKDRQPAAYNRDEEPF